MLTKEAYLEAFHADHSALADAAQRDVTVPLPSCPGWPMAHLLGHLGAIYLSITKNIRVGHGEDVVNELEDLDLSPEFEEWFRRDEGLDALPATVVEWYREVSKDLEAAFRSVELSERTWTWFPTDQTVGFWIRRMTQETAVHRWDAQLAVGVPDPIPAELARDGIDEALTIYQPSAGLPKSQTPGRGETYEFAEIDGPGRWVVRFQDGTMQTSHEPVKADVTIRAGASDLLLFLWHRIPADGFEIEGDRSLVDRYFELVPPD